MTGIICDMIQEATAHRAELMNMLEERARLQAWRPSGRRVVPVEQLLPVLQRLQTMTRSSYVTFSAADIGGVADQLQQCINEAIEL